MNFVNFMKSVKVPRQTAAYQRVWEPQFWRPFESFVDEMGEFGRPFKSFGDKWVNLGEPENSTKTLKPGFAKDAVDANLLRLGSTNPKNNSQPLDVFFFHSNRFSRIDLDPFGTADLSSPSPPNVNKFARKVLIAALEKTTKLNTKNTGKKHVPCS